MFVLTHHILMVFMVTAPRKVEIISCYSTFDCMLSMTSSFVCIAMLLKNCIIFHLTGNLRNNRTDICRFQIKVPFLGFYSYLKLVNNVPSL